MSIIPILHNPNPELRVVSQPVADTELRAEVTQQLIEDLIDTMYAEDGVGIAAPQVGKHVRIIIADTAQGPQAYVNPEITSRSVRMIASTEGCLSVPGVSGTVKRHSSVIVCAKNRHGEAVEVKANGLLAVIFQHEIDHLDGILFIDRANSSSDSVTSRL